MEKKYDTNQLFDIRIRMSCGEATEEEITLWNEWSEQPHIKAIPSDISEEEIKLWFELNANDPELVELFNEADEKNNFKNPNINET